MAYPRGVFKNKLEEYIGGALGEFYKAECAKANGLTKWVVHWSKEVQQLLGHMATQVYLHPIRGFKDRHKALTEALIEIRRQDIGYRNYAMNQVVRDYKLKKLKVQIPFDKTEQFFAMVEQFIRDVEIMPPIEEWITPPTRGGASNLNSMPQVLRSYIVTQMGIILLG